MGTASATTIDPERLERQREDLRRHGRMHWAHWTILGLSVLITGMAWYTSKTLLEERTLRRFEREANDVVELVRERLTHYEDALLSGVAAIQSRGGRITRSQWRRYAEHLRLPERYPGIGGIGVIHHVEADRLDSFVARMRRQNPGYGVYPDHGLDFHLPIAYIEPEASNTEAIGLDVAFETHRREAALRARRLATTQVSGPIVLVQDAGRTPGFLFYAPYYHESPAGSGTGPSEKSFAGLVYAPLVVRSLIAGVLDRENRNVALAIRDGEDVLYEEDAEAGRANARLEFERDVPMYGRTWSFDVRAAPEFVADSAATPLAVLVCGLAIDAMLFVLFWFMSRANRRTLGLAERMTDDLVAQAASLAAANRQLESFAHVASHDLKSPLRGVRDLAGFLEEDLQGYLESDGANPEVRQSLDELDRLARKGGALVDGILEYSLVDAGDECQATVDSRAVVDEIVASSGLPTGRFEIEGDFPTFRTSAVRFGQVLANLVGNAVKYHHDPARARIRITAERVGEFHRFAVADDGPGIEPQFHERIFEAFTTLGTRDDVDSSGIGLSIVRKSVESLGGSVAVESEPGRGATFRFDWPVSMPEPVARAA